MKKFPSNPGAYFFIRHRFTARKGSFTLVELMVSIAILSVMLVALASIMNFVMQTWLSGINTVNNFSKARTLLTLLDRDTQMMVMRRDLAAFVDGTGNNPACAFYTTVQGQPGLDTRALSLVQYTLVQSPAAANATSSDLERLNYGMNYVSGGGITPAVGYNTNLVQLANPVNPALASENVANGVIAFQCQFIDGTGGLLLPPYIPTGTTLTKAIPFYFDFDSTGAVYNPRALVVSLVVVSDNAYNLAVQTGKLGTLISQFSNATMPTSTVSSTTYDTETYAQLWNNVLNPSTGTFAAGADLPAPVIAAGTIQVFERHIPLPLTTPSN